MMNPVIMRSLELNERLEKRLEEGVTLNVEVAKGTNYTLRYALHPDKEERAFLE